MELYPHQEKAISEMHNGCILWADPGTGKTFTAIHYYLRNEAPKNVYVITTARKRDELDWEHEFLHVGITPDPDTSMGSVLVVDSWNNLGKYVGVEDAFFIFDEQRLVGSGAWVKAFYKVAEANRWVMLSATPGDTWLDYVPVFRANGFIKNITQFKQEHVLYAPYAKFPKVVGYRQVGRLVRWRNELLVHMPYERHTTRVVEDVPVGFDAELLKKVVKERWHVYEERPLKDVGELFHVMRRVVYSDSSRLEAIRTLLSSHPKLIVFYNFDYELEILRTLSNKERVTVSSTASTGDASVATVSTECPSEETARSVENPWNYLLSPEGMRENNTTQTSSSGSSLSFDKCSLKPKDGVTVAEWNGHKHEAIPRTDRWVYLVQYMAGSEAWNCIETDSMCLYSMTYSYKMWDQSFGRIDRLTTNFAKLFYYVLVSDTPIDRMVGESLRAKKSFNEKDAFKSWQEN